MIFVAALLLAACQARPLLVRQSLEEEGAVHLYLRPYPQDAERLSFSLAGIDAVREDGIAFPLSLRFREIARDPLQRERSLARGVLPPGRYSGFRVRASKAFLKGEAGPAALKVPEEPVAIDEPFQVKKAQAVVLALSFRYRDSVGAGFRFAPVFSAEIPPKPAMGAIGIASSRGENAITVFDKVSGRVSGIVPAGREPSGMAFSSERGRAYIAVPGDDRVDVVDLFEGAVVDRIRLKAGDVPVDAALTPDGRTLLTANSQSNSVSIVDPATQFETGRVPVGSRPRSVLLDPTGRRAYVFNEFSATISLVDIPSGTVTATVATDPSPIRGQFNRDRSRLFVIHGGSPYLAVLDPTSLSLLKRVYVGPGATALAVDSRTDRIYLARGDFPTIDVYDPSVLLPIDFIPSGGNVVFMTMEREQNALCVLLGDRGMLRMVRLVGKQTALEVDVGEDPYGVAFPGGR